LLDDAHLALVIADVSGKGVPAALFMMESKTMIKDKAVSGKTPSQILKEVNIGLMEHNKANLFITTWLFIIELSTGKALEANAGHEKPAICHKDGRFELVINKHGIALGFLKEAKICDYVWQLNPGDKLFVYTDGVTEATNAEDELYGTERMLNALNEASGKTQKEILPHIKSSIDAFVGSEPQFDDLTMLGFTYYGGSNS
jgi:serine phosphatase RsbU (regulator of sigma subunit)